MVKINEVNGNTCDIKYGVPQYTSELGPILFILYNNKMCDTNIDGSVVTCTDDTCLLFSHKSWDGVYDKFQLSTNNLTDINLYLDKEKPVFLQFFFLSYNTITIRDCGNNRNCNPPLQYKII